MTDWQLTKSASALRLALTGSLELDSDSESEFSSSTPSQAHCQRLACRTLALPGASGSLELEKSTSTGSLNSESVPVPDISGTGEPNNFKVVQVVVVHWQSDSESEWPRAALHSST